MGKKMDLSAFKNRITHKDKKSDDRFAVADKMMGAGGQKEKVMRKSYALLNEDIERLESIKSRCLDKKVVIKNDSHVIRLSLLKASQLSIDELIEAAQSIPKVATGRPRK